MNHKTRKVYIAFEYPPEKEFKQEIIGVYKDRDMAIQKLSKPFRHVTEYCLIDENTTVFEYHEAGRTWYPLTTEEKRREE